MRFFTLFNITYSLLYMKILLVYQGRKLRHFFPRDYSPQEGSKCGILPMSKHTIFSTACSKTKITKPLINNMIISCSLCRKLVNCCCQRVDINKLQIEPV